jgi:hypothetical protein
MSDPWDSGFAGPTDEWANDPEAPREGESRRPTFADTFVSRSALGSLPPIEPLIKDVLSLRSAAMLIGPSGAGKSFVALSWALSIATGHSWIGREVQKRRVLYVIGEGASGLNARVTAWESAWDHGVTDDEITFAVRPDTLLDANLWADVRVQCKADGFGFVVFDTMSSLWPDADETKDAARVTRRLADLSGDIDGTALIVHHPGWGDQDRPRGGSQLLANVDELLMLKGSSKSEMLQLERIKSKDDAAGSPIHLRRRPCFGSCIIEHITPTENAVREADSTEGTLRTVFGEDEFTQVAAIAAVMEQTGLVRSNAYTHVRKLIDTRALLIVGKSGKSTLLKLAPEVDPFTEDTEPF